MYAKDWHMFLGECSERAFVLPDVFSSDWLNQYYLAHPHLHDDFRFVYIGPKVRLVDLAGDDVMQHSQGSYTPLHCDVLASFSWSSNIAGCKEWIFFPPNQVSFH